jgi:hypothetical protein
MGHKSIVPGPTEQARKRVLVTPDNLATTWPGPGDQ